MCIDGDNADHATDFVNAQLHSLYKIAGACIDHYESRDVDRSEQSGYDFALREYYYKSKSSPTVKFEFGHPRVEFVCNHDAILHLDIHTVTVHSTHEAPDIALWGGVLGGLFGLGTPNKTESTTDGYSETKALSHFKGTVSVRVPFTKYKLSGRSEAIGNGEHALHSFILDLSHGYFVQTGLTTLEVTEAHRPYLEAYLEHLIKSGHHVLYSLPDFDDDEHHRAIDFSSAATASYGDVTKVFNIELELVAKFVEEAWLKAAWLAHEHLHESGRDLDLSIRNTIAVAKWEHHWRGSAPFDIEFGAPTVQLLCEREAILTFSLENIVFHASGDRKKTFKNWKIAIIVDIIYETELDGAISVLKIHAGKHAKFSQHLSHFGGCEFGDDIDWLFYETLIAFISWEYIQILVDGSFSLFYYDSRVKRPLPGRKDLWIGGVEDPDYAAGITTSTEMHGFQQIIALSHASLDSIFHTYYRERGWMRFSNEDGFKINYGVPKVRLLGGDRALVFIHLESGILRTGHTEEDKREFENWTLAFEVTLRLRDVDLSRPGEWKEYKHTHAYNATKDWKHTYIKQLYIDFESARFNYQLSKFNDKHFGRNNLTIRKVIAINQHLREHFLRQIKDAAADILYSIVISKDESDTRPRYAFFDAAFHIYSKVEVTHQNYNILSAAEEPLIVIVGTTSPKKPLHSGVLRYSGYWLHRPGFSLGTLALSADLFLNGRLLPLLANINRATTIVPASLDFDAGNWLVTATTWLEKYKKDKNYRIHPTDWELISKDRHAFEYKWDHSDEYEYNHEGAKNDRSSGTYYLALRTDNHLTIPTSFKAGQLDIIIKGTSSISLGWSRADNNNARHHAHVSWTIIISLVTDASGLRVKVDNQFEPHYESKTEGFIIAEESHRIRDPIHILKPIFPVGLTLEHELASLKKFESVWYSFYPGLKAYKLANPFFTEKGDLFLELYEHDQSPVPQSSANSLRVPGRPLLGRPSPRGKVGSLPSSPGKSPVAVPTTRPAPIPDNLLKVGVDKDGNRNGFADGAVSVAVAVAADVASHTNGKAK